MNKIGMLYICTGKYSAFWKEFYESFERYFLPNCEKHYFVFTDAEKLEYEDENKNIHRFYQAGMPWPYPTLYRFKTFLQIEQELKKMDFLFFFNANMKAVKPVTEAMILPRSERREELLVAAHPCFFDKRPSQFPYDRNPRCSAFIPYWFGKVYVQGACIGGKTEAFLKMCHVLDRRTDKDLKKGIIPLWHDESHLNRYILENKRYRYISPSFIYPEGWELPFEPVIVYRAKNRYFDEKTEKGTISVDQTPSWAKEINAIMIRLEEIWNKFRMRLRAG